MTNIVDEMQAALDTHLTLRYEYMRRGVEIDTQVYKARYILTKAVSYKLNMQENWTYFFDPSGEIIVRKKDCDNEIFISFLVQQMSGDFLFEISSYDQDDSSVCYNVDGLIDEVNKRLESDYGH
jgi:hypothetical protein